MRAQRVAVTGFAVAVVAAGCGGGRPAAVPATSSTSSVPPSSSSTSSSSSSSSSSSTTAPSTTVPSPQAVVGLTVTGAGATLTPPSSPTVLPYSADCAALVDKGYQASCVIITAPSGQIAALVEINSSTGGSDERDVVWSRVGSTWQLALRRDTPNVQVGYATVVASDVMRDGDPKAVFATPAGNAEFADEIDVVEANGTVSLQRQLHGGFATVAPGGGLETFTPSAPPAQGYDEAVIRYAGGQWTIASVTQVSQTQGQGEVSGPFTDPAATHPTYISG